LKTNKSNPTKTEISETYNNKSKNKYQHSITYPILNQIPKMQKARTKTQKKQASNTQSHTQNAEKENDNMHAIRFMKREKFTFDDEDRSRFCVGEIDDGDGEVHGGESKILHVFRLERMCFFFQRENVPA